jgi:hypothetical protein
MKVIKDFNEWPKIHKRKQRNTIGNEIRVHLRDVNKIGLIRVDQKKEDIGNFG